MHAAQSLPRRCTRASAVPSDVSLAFVLLLAATLFTAGLAHGQNRGPRGYVAAEPGGSGGGRTEHLLWGCGEAHGV